MVRSIAIAALALIVIVGCGPKPKTGSAPAPARVLDETVSEPQERAGQITARLFRRNAVDGQFAGPSLEVFSPNASEVEPGVMNFGDARVTIYSDDGQETIITARNGVLDQNNETAELSGEVVVQMGTQTLTMEHLSWNNENREAIARTGVKIVDGNTLLTAEAMHFSPDKNTLTLERVTGVIQLPKSGGANEARIKRTTWRTLAMWLVMATPAYAQVAGDSAYTQVVIEKPAPQVIFRDNRLDQMTGGVEIQLKTADENDPPLLLGADTIAFGWKEDAATELASLDMSGNVSVSNSEGQMRAANAEFDVAKMTMVFAGGVSGKFEGIDEFQADELVYEIESGDMEMRNLRAIIPFGDGQGGDADSFSRMDVQRAAVVHIAEGKVKDMSGGVEMTLTPQDKNTKPIALRAETFGFDYPHADERQPQNVVMEGGVRVDAPQGLIQSDKASFGVSSGTLKFRGNVRGRSALLKSFLANSFDYDLDTEDGLLQSFRADGVQIGDGESGYNRMDVRKAPEVRMSGGRVTNMSGGVEIFLAGDEARGPLTAEAQTIDMAYDSPDSSTPSKVDMKEDVHVTTGDTDIKSDTADLNMQTESIDFAGNFRADMPRAEGVTGSRARYDLKTGNFELYGRVDKVLRPDSDESQDQS